MVVYTRLGTSILSCDKYKDNDFNQFCSFNIMTSSGKLNFVFIYRPPSSDTNNLEKLCQIIRKSDKNTVIIGDFNLPSIDWRRGTADAKGRRLLEAAEEADMEQLVNFPTHNKGNVLDLLLTNCPDQVLSIHNEGNLSNSDHCILLIEFLSHFENKNNKKTTPNWSKADIAGIKSYLGNMNWREILTGENLENDWQIFSQILDRTVKKFVPSSTQKSVDKPRWLNRDIVRLLRKKKLAWRTAQAHRTEINQEKYKKLEKEVMNKIRNAKRNLEKKLAYAEGGNSTRTFAAYIKSKTKAKSSIGPLKNKSGKIIVGDLDMANELNDFFSSVFSNEDLSRLPAIEPEGTEKIETVQISRSKIIEKIKKLKEKSAPGPDGITPKILKTVANEIAFPLQIIFEQSLRTGIVPQIWKHATVVPIFKKGTKGAAENYRPVSLTCIICKIFESILADRITEHLTVNNLLRNTQHGFVKGRSCTTNLVAFLDKLTSIVDLGGAADLFYLDFSKAFDKVPRKRLLLKLKAKGVDGNILGWITDWLTNRTQAVRVGSQESRKSRVESGVPQGSVLGPLLFDVFIDDIDECAELIELILKFADDTKGLKQIKDDSDRKKLQDTLDELVRWSQSWCMEFNISKCKIMHVGRGNPKFKYFMNGEELKQVEEEKDIGVLVHQSLKPSKHCTKAANMAKSVLRQLTKNFHFRDRHIFKKLYIQYVRPHVEFASPAWSPWNEADIKILEDVQRMAVKMISGLNQGLSYEEKCAEIGLETLEMRRKKQDLIQAYKILNGFDKIKWEDFYTKSMDRTTRVTRATNDPMNLVVPHARLDVRKNSFFVRTPRLWNELPAETKNAPSLAAFKNTISQILTTG